MRPVIAALLLAPLVALAAPDTFAAFEPALEPLQAVYNETETVAQDGRLELLKRAGNCATNYFACSNIGAAGLCCPKTAICSADPRGAVACCPQGAACTGTIAATSLQSASATTTTTGTFVSATATTTSPFSQGANANAGSTVQNQFFPFPYIATTYTNAAACSSAYTSCQGNAAKCTAALASGAQGVTISAPNGGATITAVPSLGIASAQSICASLSSAGCYGLTVEACARFDGGNAAMKERCAGYWMTAGVALGLAGQLLQ